MLLMKRKHTIYGLMMCGALVLSSCSDFTDIQPKGKNLLTTADELEMLLNAEIDFEDKHERVMAGDMINSATNVPNQLSQPSKTRNVIMWTWDEASQDRMAELTNSDETYTKLYGYIGRICNPILTQIDGAEGDEAKKRQLRCEALTLRAYCLWQLVNKFAKAYIPATAATDRAIILLTEDVDISVPQVQSTVQQVYDKILEDVNEAIELDGLPAVAANRMRMSKPCAYAVKALALLSMQQWDEAEAAAKQALAINSTVNNYNEMINQTITGYFTGGSYPALLRPRLECEEDLFYTHGLEYYSAVSSEALSRVEAGNVAVEKMATEDMMADYLMNTGEMMLGITGYVFTYDSDSGWNPGGLKTTYMHLAIAEAELHNGNIDNAMEALDAVRVNRIDPALYAPLKGNVSSEAEAMKHVKETWSGEGIWAVYNFINRKRWNQVSGWEETYTRTIGDQTYTLSPESSMWIFPIPMNAINNNPNLRQNYKQD